MVARAKAASASGAALGERRDMGLAAPPGELVPEPALELLDEQTTEPGADAHGIGLVVAWRRLIRKCASLAFK